MPPLPFESIKKINAYGSEYWTAREIMPLLDYVEWRKFEGVIEKAKESCSNSHQPIADHFVGSAKMIKIATGSPRETLREIQDYHLSRYACYLIAQNGDPRKEEIALQIPKLFRTTYRSDICNFQRYLKMEDNYLNMIPEYAPIDK